MGVVLVVRLCRPGRENRVEVGPAAGDQGDGGVAHTTVIATISRITAGNFRLVNRLLTQIERVQTVNELDALTPEVVEAARAALLIDHLPLPLTGQCRLRTPSKQHHLEN